LKTKTRLFAAALAVAVAAGCAAQQVKTERRPDGIYHVTCRDTLQVCLNKAEELCQRQRYVVLRAYDLDDHRGGTEKETEVRTSEAFFRCGARASWGDENKALLAQDVCPAPATPPAPPASAASVGCTPGVSIACVGAGGCKGGQSCAPDGKTFGPCDCGPSPAAPAPAPSP
jgi:hypothetical protein